MQFVCKHRPCIYDVDVKFFNKRNNDHNQHINKASKRQKNNVLLDSRAGIKKKKKKEKKGKKKRL